MVRSMTGFGRFELEANQRKISVEIKAVNHRYLDLSIKMPRRFNAFESEIRSVLKKYMSRGKVDVYISCEDFNEEDVSVHYNHRLAEEYLKYLKQMQQEFGVEDDIRLSSLSRYPEVFTMEEASRDDATLLEDLKKAVEGAADAFARMREKEGEALKSDLLEKLQAMEEQVNFVEEKAPGIVKAYEERLREKVKELLKDAAVDENRLLMETTIFADKVCVDEEMVRLKSHIKAVEDCLKKGGEVGRKLDFLAQEMNREANTTMSKSQDLDVTNAAIMLKTEIEKIREQVQNLE